MIPAKLPEDIPLQIEMLNGVEKKRAEFMSMICREERQSDGYKYNHSRYGITVKEGSK